MSKLQVGDVVVCVEGYSPINPFAPVEGEVYEVLEVDYEGFVRISKGADDKTPQYQWLPERFEKLGDVR